MRKLLEGEEILNNAIKEAAIWELKWSDMWMEAGDPID